MEKKDQNKLCASNITAETIHTYFGDVKHNVITEELPCDVDSDSIITIILNHLANNDLLSVKSLEEFKACMKEDIPEEVDKHLPFDSFVNTYTRLLDRVKEITDHAASRKDFYFSLKKSIHETENRSRAVKAGNYVVYCMERLNLVCAHELQLDGDQPKMSEKEKAAVDTRALVYWRDLWCSLMNSVTESMSDDKIAVMIMTKGTCETLVEIIDDLESTTDRGSDPDAKPSLSTPAMITVKPDFVLYANFGKDIYHRKQFCVIGEVKTTYCDDEINPLSESSDSERKVKNDSKRKAIGSTKPRVQKICVCAGENISIIDGPASKKQKTNHGEQPGRSNSVQHITPGDDDQFGNKGIPAVDGERSGNHDLKNAVKADGLTKLKTQHFMELFGMMRHGFLNYSQYRGARKIFGLYTVKNNAYITCLTTTDSKDIPKMTMFVCSKLASEFHKANNDNFSIKFEMTVLPALNIFNAAHFKALLTFMKFLTWVECKK